MALNNNSDKKYIFSNVTKLQGKKGVNDKAYRIDNQLPPKMREAKKKNRNFIWRNKKSVAEKLSMSVQKGKLIMEGNTYRPWIREPDVDKLVQLRKDEILELEEMKVIKGIPQIEGSSTFIGYVGDVNSFEDINRAYEYVRYMNMGARHIICACIVPGSNVIESVDYCDSDEHGAGHRLLEYMESAELTNRVIFVARHYDGQHIRPKRFELIINATKSAVNQKPLNELTGKFQFSWGSKKQTHHKDQSDEERNEESDQEIVLQQHRTINSWADLTETSKSQNAVTADLGTTICDTPEQS